MDKKSREEKWWYKYILHVIILLLIVLSFIAAQYQTYTFTYTANLHHCFLDI